MNLEGQFLFFFSALGAFNGLLLSLYFIVVARPKALSNYFFGAMLLALSVRVGKSVFYHFNPSLSLQYLQIGLSGCFLIGPFLYLYLLSTKQKATKFKLAWLIHIALLFSFIVLARVFYPYEEYASLWRTTIIKFIYLEWLLYLIASGIVLRAAFQQLFIKPKLLIASQKWQLSIFAGNVVIFVAYNTVSYTSYIAGALSFSFMFYVLVMLLITQRKKAKAIPSKKKYNNRKIENSEVEALTKQLWYLMEEKQSYKNADLKLNDLASELNVLPHRLSQLLNDNMGKSFALFINEYRIEAAKKMLQKEHQITLEAIGYDCGFSSQSNFYATFKKLTGTTPAKFKKQLLGVQK